MKYDKNEIKDHLRGGLALQMHKAGGDLSDLENALTNTKVALEKTALPSMKDVLNMVLGAGKMYAGTAAMAGTVGGLGLYGAYKGMADSQGKIEEQEVIRRRIEQAQQELDSAILDKQQHEQQI